MNLLSLETKMNLWYTCNNYSNDEEKTWCERYITLPKGSMVGGHWIYSKLYK